MATPLHPQVQSLLRGVLRPAIASSTPTIETIRLTAARLTPYFAGPGEPIAETWDAELSGTGGTLLPVRWYRPSQAYSLLVFVHGGGWIAGSLDSYDTFCRALALRTGFTVLSVAYSLAPESHFPVALGEIVQVFEQAPSLERSPGLRPGRWAVAGDSAGGSLVASALHRLTCDHRALPAAAVLLYPVLDAAMSQDSYSRYLDGYHLTATRMQWYWEQYLGMPLHSLGDRVRHSDISPLYSSHLQSFPPTMIVTAEYDLLHDEGISFATRLREAGVPVNSVEAAGYIHGFMRFRAVLTDPISGPDATMLRMAAFLENPAASGSL